MTVPRRLVRLAALLFALNLQHAFAETPDEVSRLLNENRLQEALLAADSSLAANEDNFELHAMKGVVLARLGQLEEAADWYRNMIGRWPDQPGPRVNLGIVYEWQGRIQTALITFLEVAKRDPDHGFALEKIGDMHIRLAADAYTRSTNTANQRQELMKKRYLSLNFDQFASQLVADTEAEQGDTQ